MTTDQTPKSLAQLTDAGVSIWLDDLDRHRIASGDLAHLVEVDEVRGVTTNPTIFAKALSGATSAYADQLRELAATSASVDDAVRALTTTDVRDACDVLDALWRETSGVDGRVSIEVDPRLARETELTVLQARLLHGMVERGNVLIKIPATVEGIPAITEVLGSGISVNVTLIFSIERYAEVLDAWMSGLERAAEHGHDLSRIESVASFFVSRMDSAVDARLDAIGTPEALALKGYAALASARLAWGVFQQAIASPRWQALLAQGAHPQRPLWASTGVKDPAFPADMYVMGLVVDGCVNTMPEATLQASAASSNFTGDTVSDTQGASRQTWDALEALGINEAAVCLELEDEGVAKFEQSWSELLDTVSRALEAARA
ncbi:MAG: transaldolase [Actinobacteria bacterium]|nr:transaldolase [Actinomycetota bacterium]